MLGAILNFVFFQMIIKTVAQGGHYYIPAPQRRKLRQGA